MTKRGGSKPTAGRHAFAMPAGKAGGSPRASRVAEQVRQELGRMFTRDVGDPRLEGIIVASVTMSPDLRLARVAFRLTFGSDDERRAAAERALEKAAGRLRKAVTARLGLRVAPELRFFFDEEQEARDRIDALLEEVKNERKL